MAEDKKVILRDKARRELREGIMGLSSAVAITLGPRGKTVAIETTGGNYKVTKDGVTVAKAISFKDRAKDAGASLLRHVAQTTNDNVGDGTTTATVLASSIVSEGYKAVVAGMNPMDIRRGIELARDTVISELKKMSRNISKSEEIKKVAMISANSDDVIANMIADAINKVGVEGVITIEDGKGMDSEIRITEGMQFDRGYISPYFTTNNEKMLAEFDDAYILIFDKKISALQPMLPLLEAISGSGKPLLIVAEDVEGEALTALIINKLRGGLRVAAVKAPGFGDRRKAMLEDLAILTGGQLVTEDTGMKLESVNLKMLGRAKKIIIKKDSTTIIDGICNAAELDSRRDYIRHAIKECTSDYDKEKLQERLAYLSGGVAVISVGAATEPEAGERKDRFDDALRAVRAALKEGVVPGGGVALLRATRTLSDLRGSNEDQNVGIKIVIAALKSPMRQIAENAGVEGSVVINNVLNNSNVNYGFDAQKLLYCDMMESGIIDPTKVVRTALIDAVSIGVLIITTDALVVNVSSDSGHSKHGGHHHNHGGMGMDDMDF